MLFFFSLGAKIESPKSQSLKDVQNDHESKRYKVESTVSSCSEDYVFGEEDEESIKQAYEELYMECLKVKKEQDESNHQV